MWIYLESLSYLITELFAPHTVPSFACACRVSTLNHKTLYISVEYRPIVIATGTKCQKILNPNKLKVNNGAR